MPKGGYRPGAGRPKGAINRKTLEQRLQAQAEQIAQMQQSKELAQSGAPTSAPLTPLAYVLALMNDPTVDPARRDRLAIAALPYVHDKAAEHMIGKKDRDQKAATEAASGKFAAPTPPRLVVDNG